jgi:hypothetical protein
MIILILSLLGVRSSHCLSGAPVSGNLFSAIDPDTPDDLRTTISLLDGSSLLQLVMSDEFNIDGRIFSKGQDSLFEAVEKPDNSNEAIQFCTTA